MKRILLSVASVLWFMIAHAQMTLDHTFATDFLAEPKIIHLALSGNKIMIVGTHSRYVSTPYDDTIFFYNMDFSFWKHIVLHPIPNKVQAATMRSGSIGGVYYPSETLFNTDTLLEVGVLYGRLSPPYGLHSGDIYIVNEQGIMTDSIMNVSPGVADLFKVYKVGTAFKMAVTINNGVSIYSLPGTLPCDPCEMALGALDTKEILTEPYPNPSADRVKIVFQLPEGLEHGELQLFTQQGRMIGHYKIDNRFGFLLLDNSELPSGMYYYSIIANGAAVARKMLVVR